jgi:hypothetical protein
LLCGLSSSVPVTTKLTVSLSKVQKPAKTLNLIWLIIF